MNFAAWKKIAFKTISFTSFSRISFTVLQSILNKKDLFIDFF